MTSRGRIWQNLTWSWACTTGHPASDRRLEGAAQTAWPYAQLCAWTYLNDRDLAYDLMDEAMENTAGYLGRHPDCAEGKLSAHFKSAIKRRARQRASKRRLELLLGSLHDLETMYVGQPDVEQSIYAGEIFARLSPFARAILEWRSIGYTWRKIAAALEMDHTAVRRAYLREMESLLRELSQSGETAE